MKSLMSRRRQIEELYHSARERGREVLAGADPELRTEVEKLLAQESGASILDASAQEVPPDSTQTVVGVGAHVGPYRIEAKLGEGGMGEVFRATDTRLQRTVAIKILPRDKTADPDRKRRFLQEARAASALNHPNIITLHDLANHDGTDYLVMEYVPGTSLDKLIKPKGVPLADAIAYATQIASALAAAHAAGIVHRDIKPANVMVAGGTRIKVLDFGLAKLSERAASADNETENLETETGMVIGTAAYMSPEQASARPVDHRTDIFSLGVVFYELISGHRPFKRKSQAETLHAIINEPALPLTDRPPALQEIFEKALAKDPKERYFHVNDFVLDLTRLASKPAVAAKERRRPTHVVLVAVAALFALGIPASWWAARWAQSGVGENPLANAKFTRFTDFPGDELDAAISPDGKFVAFISDRDGPFDIFLSRVGSGSFANLTLGTQQDLRGTYRPVGFSRDGSEIWLHDGSTETPVRIMPLLGGQPRVFLGPRSFNVAWSPDGARLAYHTSEDGDPLFVADTTGADIRRIFVGRPGWHNHFPVWSPDGNWIYFVSGIRAANAMDLWRIRSSGGEPERLTQHNADVGFPAPLDARNVLYIAQDADGSGPWLWMLDVERRVARRVSFGLDQYTSVSASADGRHLVATAANPTAGLWSAPILDRVTEEPDVKAFSVPAVRALMPRLSAAAVFYISSRGGGDGLWRYQDGQAQEIWKGANGALLEPPAISFDGRRVAFVLRRNGKLRLQRAMSDGTEPQALGTTLNVQGAASWSPDGKWIATGGQDDRGLGLFKVPTDGGDPIRLASGFALNPVWSPDGTLIVYAGPNVARFSPLLAVRPDGSRVEMPAILLNRDGERVRFLPNGRGLVYMQGQGASQDFFLLDLASRKSRRLTLLTNTAAMRTFDVTPDGKQIVFDRLRENSDLVLIDLPENKK